LRRSSSTGGQRAITRCAGRSVHRALLSCSQLGRDFAKDNACAGRRLKGSPRPVLPMIYWLETGSHASAPIRIPARAEVSCNSFTLTGQRDVCAVMKIVVPHCIDAEAAAAVDNKWVARCGSFSASSTIRREPAAARSAP